MKQRVFTRDDVKTVQQRKGTNPSTSVAVVVLYTTMHRYD